MGGTVGGVKYEVDGYSVAAAVAVAGMCGLNVIGKNARGFPLALRGLGMTFAPILLRGRYLEI